MAASVQVLTLSYARYTRLLLISMAVLKFGESNLDIWVSTQVLNTGLNSTKSLSGSYIFKEEPFLAVPEEGSIYKK